MKTLFLDLKNGIAGDMIVAALLNMNVMPFEEFNSSLKSLSISNEFSLEYVYGEKFGISGGDFFVIEKDKHMSVCENETCHKITNEHTSESICIGGYGYEPSEVYGNKSSERLRSEAKQSSASPKSRISVYVPVGNLPPVARLRRAYSFTKFGATKSADKNEHHREHDEHQHDEHHGRNLNDIFKIIDTSKISVKAKELAKEIFNNLAEAEAKAHNKKISEIHFHEVGAVDSIVDIVGFSVLFTKLNPDMVICSDINLGQGTVKCDHGVLNVPVPAVLNLVKGFPVYCDDIKFELTTPTGAAIVKTVVKKFDNNFKGKLIACGKGFGKRDILVRPNALEIFLFENGIEADDIIEINTNIDNTPAEDLGYTAKLLLKEGALDVCFSPVFMKKFRPGYKLEVLCRLSDLDKLAKIIFENTCTIGLRYSVKKRIVLERTEGSKDTKFGKVKTKIVHFCDSCEEYPEYDSLEKICEKNNLSIKEVRKL